MAKNKSKDYPRDKDGEVIPQNHWWCESCQMKKKMTQEQMKAHVLEKHGFDASKTKGMRSMLMHMDGADWFAWQWQWTLNGPNGNVVLTQSTVSPRAQDDMMRYA